jgi:hypothetical protein
VQGGRDSDWGLVRPGLFGEYKHCEQGLISRASAMRASLRDIGVAAVARTTTTKMAACKWRGAPSRRAGGGDLGCCPPEH